MDKCIAVIDLGTNTCNLLIASYQLMDYQILYQGKEAVKLGKKGIHKNLLTEEGLERAIKAIHQHQHKIATYAVSEVIVIATSAIREATNKEWFQQQIKQRTGLDLTIISGEKEAELIFKGVKLAFNTLEDYTLILDIGGGSNEFILIENQEPAWKQSFRLGVARVVEQMPPSDPITGEEIHQISQWFDQGLTGLWERLKEVPVTTLIGCSGAFNTLADLIDQTHAGTKARVQQEITISDFKRIFEMLVTSTTEQRRTMKGMEPLRVEMIVPAILFIKLIVERLKIQRIYYTDFALMEGVLYERVNESKK
jgi:exopolyphosphatase/guanosine-5'-triphosphate,3'-diphosphate pyrophosphatase